MTTNTITEEEFVSASRGIESRLLHLLPLVALTVDFLTPVLISYGVLPSQVRWLSDLAIAAMLGLVLLHVLTFDYIPKTLLAILAITLIWVTAAILNGQGPLPTIWGWWQLFKYPFAGLFVYLYHGWPTSLARTLPRILVFLLGLQVILQIGQFISGVPIGDNLAGTFGNHGVTVLLMFTLLTVAMAFGTWLATGNWKILSWALLLGTISSVLGENKLFLPALVLFGGAGLTIHIIRGHRLRSIWSFLIMAGLVLAGFWFLYNRFAVEFGSAIHLEEYLNPNQLYGYLNINQRVESGEYDLGRNFGLAQGWRTISRDPTNLLFGLGMGSRSESVALGAVGQALSNSYYGLTVVSSLLVMMQEFGLVGLGIGLFFMLWTCLRLYRDTITNTDPSLDAIRFGLLLFTLFWPLWLWYTTVWVMRTPMLVYWMTLGYVSNREIIAYFNNQDAT